MMDACLEAGVYYTDMCGLFHTTRKQLELHDKFAAAGLSAILGTGSAPGIPNIQAGYAADRLDTLIISAFMTGTGRHYLEICALHMLCRRSLMN